MTCSLRCRSREDALFFTGDAEERDEEDDWFASGVPLGGGRIIRRYGEARGQPDRTGQSDGPLSGSAYHSGAAGERYSLRPVSRSGQGGAAGRCSGERVERDSGGASFAGPGNGVCGVAAAVRRARRRQLVRTVRVEPDGGAEGGAGRAVYHRERRSGGA